MNITCVICSDLFTPSSDIYSTPCGHIFHYHCLLHWLENSKTCPQCRQKVSKNHLVRLFVNIITGDGISDDVTVLQHKLDGCEFQLRLKDKDIENFKEKYREIKKQNVGLKEEIKRIEQTERTHESAIAALKDQIKFFKEKSQNCEKLKQEVGRLKQQMKDLENVQLAVTASRQQVEDIIRNENNVESLALLAATLKKSLVDSDRGKHDLQIKLKRTKNEYLASKKKLAEISCQYEETRRQLESLKLNYEKEVTFLKNKFANLEAKVATGNSNDSLNRSIQRITAESPVNYHRTPVLTKNRDSLIVLDDLPENTHTSRLQPPTKKTTTETEIIDLTPPSPSATNTHIYKTPILGNQTNTLLLNSQPYKFSIFKNNPPSMHAVMKGPSSKSSDVAYDGFGGSSKEDVFPSPKNVVTGIKRSKSTKMSSSKFKKLSAEAGKKGTQKVSDFLFNLNDI